jgi:hypothetical protein
MRNEVSFRADLNVQGFDAGHFVFAPFADSVAAVFVTEVAHDLAHRFHLRAVDFPARAIRGYLFIRFAWSVINFLSPGLEEAAKTVRPPGERPDGGGFLKVKRKRQVECGGSPKKTARKGGAMNGDTLGGENSRSGTQEHIGGECSEDGESAPKTDEERETLLCIFDAVDADLQSEYMFSRLRLFTSPPLSSLPHGWRCPSRVLPRLFQSKADGAQVEEDEPAGLSGLRGGFACAWEEADTSSSMRLRCRHVMVYG